MDFKISEYVVIREECDQTELPSFALIDISSLEKLGLMGRPVYYSFPVRICIKNDWYDTIPLQQVARAISPIDGGFHFLYIQINLNTNEYYIGKVNRRHWKEVKRYQGSGLKFKGKYKGHENEFVRYFIVQCSTSKETEDLEAAIVDEELLKDPKCLNLVCGGGGTNEHFNSEKRAANQRKYMKDHPEQYQSMIEASKKIYQIKNSSSLKKRNESIKKTMSGESYREMSRERMIRWRNEHPEEYQQARENNRKALQKPEVKERKAKARQKWIEEHPEEYKNTQKKLLIAQQTPEARNKRAASLKQWAEEHPEEAAENLKRRSAASLEKSCKPVEMCDLESGKVLRIFRSQHEAARWLVENGLAKNTNCACTIGSVCQKKPCTSGYGYRKKAYGYGWQYAKKPKLPET